MLAACALMIKRRELRELHVFSCEITFRIDRKISPSIGTAFIDRYNFALTDVSDRIRAFQNFERLSRLIVDLEIARNA